MVRKEGFTTLVTQIYDSRDPYTLNDSVFAVKDSLIVNFVDSKRSDVKFDLTYDITLSRAR